MISVDVWVLVVRNRGGQRVSRMIASKKLQLIDQYHDEIFKRRRHYQSPYFVFHTVPVFRHVPLQRSGLYGKIDTRFLKHTLSAIVVIIDTTSLVDIIVTSAGGPTVE